MANALRRLLKSCVFFSPSLLAWSALAHRFAGMLVGGCRVLIRSSRAFLRRADAALRLLVNLFDLVASIFDLLTVTASLLAHLIHLRLNGSSSVLHVFFGCTPTGEQSARHDASGSKESFHSLKPRMGLNAIGAPMWLTL